MFLICIIHIIYISDNVFCAAGFGGFDALDYHSGRFECLDLLILPDDRSDFDVHRALEDDKVKKLRINMSYLIHMMHMNTVIILIIPIIAIMLINASFIIISKSLHLSTPFLWICSICSWPSCQVHLLGVC